VFFILFFFGGGIWTVENMSLGTSIFHECLWVSQCYVGYRSVTLGIVVLLWVS
jgi:hypothetical protein